MTHLPAKIAAGVAALLLAGCEPPTDSARSEPAQAAETAQGWQYSSSKDEMDGTVTETACVASEAPVSAEAPHHPSHANLCFFRKAGGTIAGAYLSMNGAGQIVCYDCDIRIKSDEKPPETAPASEAGNGNSDLLIFTMPSWLYLKVAVSKRFAVEPRLYDAPSPVIWFKTENLAWAQPKK